MSMILVILLYIYANNIIPTGEHPIPDMINIYTHTIYRMFGIFGNGGTDVTLGNIYRNKYKPKTKQNKFER